MPPFRLSRLKIPALWLALLLGLVGVGLYQGASPGPPPVTDRLGALEAPPAPHRGEVPPAPHKGEVPPAPHRGEAPSALPRVAGPVASPRPVPDLAPLQAALEQALQGRDEARLQALLEQLAGVETTPAVAALRSQVNYALDRLAGIIYLNEQNSRRWSLAATEGQPLGYPIDLSANDNWLYLVEQGAVYRADLSDLSLARERLALTPILTPGAPVDGYPVKEIVAVEASHLAGAVFALDKAGDLYRYDLEPGEWSLETVAGSPTGDPAPLYQNLGSFDNRLYLLDPARNQIWRHPPNAAGPAYLPQVTPWQLQPGQPDLRQAIDLAVDGHIYVLQRDGAIVVYTPAEAARFSLARVAPAGRVAGQAARPAALFATVEGQALWVADPGRRRVVALNREDGTLLGQFSAPDNLDFAALRGVIEQEERLLILAGPRLYAYDLSQGMAPLPPPRGEGPPLTPPRGEGPPLTSHGGGEGPPAADLSLAGQLPVLAPLPPHKGEGPPLISHGREGDLSPADLLPHDPRLPGLLATYNFSMPLRGAWLPDRSAVYPGSRRAYRAGVHQGLDLFGQDVGLEVAVGTPVYAAAAGRVLRADLDYQEMSLAEVQALLDEANERRLTPAGALEKLNGRQVWLEHGPGVATRYSHLSQIRPGLRTGQRVEAGQLIGYVGLSGSLDGISGRSDLAHLHFEIRLGSVHQYYLGQWLSLEATRRAFEHIFPVPLRPADLERESQTLKVSETFRVFEDSLSYPVQAGDTLIEIGRRFGLDHQDLAAANALDPTDLLQIGQVLIIPGRAPAGQGLGESAGGWPLEVYQFGDGPQRMVWVGGLHGGYEWNTILLAYQAIDFFAAHPEYIPPSVSLEIIPAANPDGQAAVVGQAGRFGAGQVPADPAVVEAGRFNGNEVDLNRNWDCRWQPSALWRDQEVRAGSAPFSEPENQALRDFLTSPPAAAVVFWHSALPGVIAGGCGARFTPAERLARVYAEAAGYPLLTEFEAYEVTGDAGDWLAGQDIPAITVELTNHTDLDWEQNLAGMLAVLDHFK